MFVGSGGGVEAAAEGWAGEGFFELGDGVLALGGLDEGGDLVPVFGVVWVVAEVFAVEDLWVGEDGVDEDWPGLVLVGDGGEPMIEAGGGVPGFGVGWVGGVGVPGGPVAFGCFGPVGGEVFELGLGEGFGVEVCAVGPGPDEGDGEEEEGGDDGDDEDDFFHGGW